MGPERQPMTTPSDALPATTTSPVPFPRLDPNSRPPVQQAPAMSKHSRTNSFFSSLRPQKQNSNDSGHPRTVSLYNTGGSAPAVAVNQQQTQNHQRSPVPQSAFQSTSTTTMASQSAAAVYQQPLPATPPQPAQQVGFVGSNDPAPPAPNSSLGPPTPSKASGQPPPLHPEIRSVVGLTVAHAHKIYFSGRLVRRVERQPDGQRPHKDEGWTDVWAQLGGTTLSVWDMKEVDEARKQGTEVPPIYVNVTDAFIQVLGSVTVPGTATSPPKRYTNVLTLNTAGQNLLLFSCPSTSALISWASALRLAAWEKSRLEEIYTAHLIRITLSNRDYPTSLVRGKLEGWAQIRIAGQTDWKRVWVTICESSIQAEAAEGRNAESSPTPGQGKRRMSNLFGKGPQAAPSNLPMKPTIYVYSGIKPKDKKKPLLTITDVSQAFSVYPERPDLIPRSPLIKVEGTFGPEETAMSMKSREGWALIMPLMDHLGPNVNQSAEMLKWVIALHDAFCLYGRPQSWTWDPRDPVSLMFGYPVGPQKEHLFLDREAVENMDPRDDRTSVIRSRLREMLIDFIKSPVQQEPPRNGPNGGPPSLPPISGVGEGPSESQGQQNGAQQQRLGSGPQLPPLSFGANSERPAEIGRPLTPITERDRDSVMTNNIGASGDNHPQSQESTAFSPLSPQGVQKQASLQPSLGAVEEQTAPQSTSAKVGQEVQGSILGRDVTRSPATMSPANSFTGASILSGLSGIPPLGETLGGPSNQSNINQQAGRTSVDSNRSNASRPSYSATSPTNAPGSSFSPNRRGDGGFAQAQSTRPLSPASPSKDKQRERTDESSDELFNQHQTLRTVLQQPKPVAPPQPAPTLQTSSSTSDRGDDLVNEAGAMYFMHQQEDHRPEVKQPQPPQQQAVNFDDEQDDYDSNSDIDNIPKAASKRPAIDTASLQSSTSSARKAPVRQSTPMAFSDTKSTLGVTSSNNGVAANTAPSTHPAPSTPSIDSGSRTTDRSYTAGLGRPTLGRKPSGARAPQPIPKLTQSQVAGYGSSSHLASQYEEEEDEDEGNSFSSNRRMQQKVQHQELQEEEKAAQRGPAMVSSTVPDTYKPSAEANFDDGDVEALAALAYLDVSEEPSRVPSSEPSGGHTAATAESSPQLESGGSATGSAFKSSFAPSRQAEERKKKAQAQQAAQHATITKPGRANGKKRNAQAAGGWGESSDEDEEEEEEEEDDDDVDSDGEPSQAAAPPPRMQQQQAMQAQQQQQQQQFAQSSVYPSVGGGQQVDQYSHMRPPRTLPQPPGSRPSGSDEYQSQQMPRHRTISGNFTESGRRSYFDNGQSQLRPNPEGQNPGAARQTVWSQVLEAGRPGANFVSPNESQPTRDTFVNLEPSETMTKAFTPQGLLSAGMQDKQDRSAKRQEELARETGASLINVPNKPPPPQTGLLGAITAHERERKREGGVGAALTEREREKRVAEERQRRFDEQQRQQMDQMQQGGSMYGAPYGFNPMMNPMMMGMNPMMGMAPMMTGGGGVNPMMGGQPALNPMMTGGGMNPMMGYGMMPNFNPHVFAAQQAAQAYQNAMMAFSVAGSQVGGDGAGPAAQQNPAMMGQGNMGGMGGFDPRMSMNMMGMMGGMNPQMGNPQMMGNPLGAQTTGMSQFDPRFGTPGMNGSGDGGQLLGSGNFTPLNNGSNQNLSTPNSQFVSGNNSPIGRGASPLRQSETPQRSRPGSPKA
ncbi:hypothetical protein DFP72DRAFT_121002 [Ephemerocybe angulata]|uniref:Skg3/CAF120-like PH-like domain-containing protein n=1 Tax=Ephemerocybe angulata TaxID=980116 RepID=A0A8H6I8V3_9AGAR|nr:hypothetical protein DFP72DRAFT_121002 [Tulosesus angulatus]